MAKSVELELLAKGTDKVIADIEEIELKAKDLEDMNPELKVQIQKSAMSAIRSRLKEEFTGSGIEQDMEAEGEKSGLTFGTALKGGAIGAVAGLAIPLVGGVLAALPGLGALAGIAFAGAWLYETNPKFAANVKKLGDTAKGVLSASVAPMTGPLTKALGQLSGFVTSLQPVLTNFFSQLAPDVQPLLTGLEGLIKNVLPPLLGLITNNHQAVVNFGKGLGDLGQSVGEILSGLSKFIGFMAPLLPLVMRLAPYIAIVVGAIKLWTLAQGALDIVMEANPIVWVIAVVALLVLGIILLVTHLHDAAHVFDIVRHAVASWGHDVAGVFDDVRHTVATWMNDVAHYFDDVRHAVATLGHNIASTFDTIRHTIASWVDDVGTYVSNAVKWFAGLPGRIANAVGNLGTTLYNAGVAILQGLLNGIDSMWQTIVNKVSNLGSTISGAFKSVLGIFSPSRVFAEHGLNIVQGLTQGISGNSHMATSAVRNLGNGLTSSLAVSGAVGSRNAPLQMEWVGGSGADQEFITWLKKNIRVRGGNPAVLGR